MDLHRRHPAVLMADDDPDDCLLVEDAFKTAQMKVNLRFVEDGQELVDYLRRNDRFADTTLSPCPDLVLLDLNMPRKDGREALKEIKSDPVLRSIPIVIFTTSAETEDVRECYELGASSFIIKPAEFDELLGLATMITKYWFGLVQLPLRNEQC